MRVFIALQMMSQTSIRMIKDMCSSTDSIFNIQDYQPMIEVFEKIDRLVDITNGNGSKGKDRKVELINHPRHDHIKELFSILRVFEEWKTECGGFNTKIVTGYTYKDLVWMVLMTIQACTWTRIARK